MILLDKNVHCSPLLSCLHLKQTSGFFLDTISGLSNPLINSTAICSTISSKYKFSNGEMKYSCPGKITDNEMEMEKGTQVQHKTKTSPLFLMVVCYTVIFS